MIAVDLHEDGGTVLVSGGDHVMTGVGSHHRHQTLEAPPEVERRHAHGAALAAEGPTNDGLRASSCQIPSLRQPAHRLDLCRVAGHPHVGAVGETPTVQLILLHCGEDVLPVRAPGQTQMRTRPAESFGVSACPALPTRG